MSLCAAGSGSHLLGGLLHVHYGDVDGTSSPALGTTSCADVGFVFLAMVEYWRRVFPVTMEAQW